MQRCCLVEVDLVIEVVQARKTFGFEAQSREILAFTCCIVAGRKSFRGSRVEITTCALGKVEEAFSITPLSAVATLSCCVLRSFVPVCIIMGRTSGAGV